MVWLPSDDEQSIPATKDTNTGINFFISSLPSVDGSPGNCDEWIYHHGTMPSKQQDSRQPLTLVDDSAVLIK